MILRELAVSLGLQVDGAGFANAEKAIAALRAGAMGLVTAVAAAGAGIVAAAGFTASTADHIDELSQSLGVGTDELQRLGYAAGFSSVSMETMGRSMKFLAKNGAKDVRAELLKLADQFEKMPDGGAKTRLAMEKLGRTGADLIPMLNEGRSKLEELFAEAPVLDKETIKEGVVLSDSITRIQGAIKKLTFAVGAPLLKPLGQLANLVIKWFNANEKLIRSNIGAFVDGFIEGAKTAWEVISMLIGGVDTIAQLMGGWANVLRITTAALVAFGIATHLPLVGLGMLLLLLNSFKRYAEGKDSVVGDWIEGWQKMVKTMFEAPGWKDSEFVTFIKWVGQNLKDMGIAFGRAKQFVTGKPQAMADLETSDESALSEKYKAFQDAAGIRGMSAEDQGYGGQIFRSRPEGGGGKNTTIHKIDINVDGSKSPADTAKAVREELGSLLEEAHEAYS